MVLHTKFLLAFLAISLLTGCAKEEESAPETLRSEPGAVLTPAETTEPEEPGNKPSTDPPPAKVKKVADSSTGVFSGVIKYKGTAPVLEPIVKAGDPNVKDAKVCAANAVPDQTLVVNGANNGIANVFVYLKSAPEGATETTPPEDPLVVDHDGCKFKPHAVFTQAGQSLQVINSDATSHNVHTYPIRNDPVNSLIAANDPVGFSLDFNGAEPLPMKIGCDIHPWMVAWVLILDHPYAAVTDENGEFSIPGLPPGTHEFRVWHEKAGYLEKGFEAKIMVGEGKPETLEYGPEIFEE